MVVIRSARPSEQRLLTEIGLAAWERAVAEWGEDVRRLQPATRQAYETFVRGNWSIILVAEDAGAPAGWAAREGHDNRISDLWVAPYAQRQGLGNALLDALESEIRASGHDTAEVETHARNDGAIALYKQRGYCVSALTLRYSPQIDRDIEQILLRKEFAP